MGGAQSEKQKNQTGKSTCNMYVCFSVDRSVVHSSESVAIILVGFWCMHTYAPTKIIVYTYAITYSDSCGE